VGTQKTNRRQAVVGYNKQKLKQHTVHQSLQPPPALVSFFLFSWSTFPLDWMSEHSLKQQSSSTDCLSKRDRLTNCSRLINYINGTRKI